MPFEREGVFESQKFKNNTESIYEVRFKNLTWLIRLIGKNMNINQNFKLNDTFQVAFLTMLLVSNKHLGSSLRFECTQYYKSAILSRC